MRYHVHAYGEKNCKRVFNNKLGNKWAKKNLIRCLFETIFNGYDDFNQYAGKIDLHITSKTDFAKLFIWKGF